MRTKIYSPVSNLAKRTKLFDAMDVGQRENIKFMYHHYRMVWLKAAFWSRPQWRLTNWEGHLSDDCCPFVYLLVSLSQVTIYTINDKVTLKVFATDVIVIWKRFIRAYNGSAPYFPICQGTLPWQPNNAAVMIANWYVHSLHVRQMATRFCFATTCDTAAPSGLFAILCHAFLVNFVEFHFAAICSFFYCRRNGRFSQSRHSTQRPSLYDTVYVVSYGPITHRTRASRGCNWVIVDETSAFSATGLRKCTRGDHLQTRRFQPPRSIIPASRCPGDSSCAAQAHRDDVTR